MSNEQFDLVLLQKNLNILRETQEDSFQDLIGLMSLAKNSSLKEINDESSGILSVANALFHLTDPDFDATGVNIDDKKRLLAETALGTSAESTYVKFESLSENLSNPQEVKSQAITRGITSEMATKHLNDDNKEADNLNIVSGVLLLAPAVIISLLANENFPAAQRMITIISGFSAAAWYNFANIVPNIKILQNRINQSIQTINDYKNLSHPESVELIQLIKSAANIHSTY